MTGLSRAGDVSVSEELVRALGVEIGEGVIGDDFGSESDATTGLSITVDGSVSDDCVSELDSAFFVGY